MKPSVDGILLGKEELMELCRPGAGADTCIWLVSGDKGFECLYFNREARNLLGETLEERLKAGKTVAKRDGCQKVIEFVEGIKKGVQAVRDGKVRPWSEIRKELELGLKPLGPDRGPQTPAEIEAMQRLQKGESL